MAKPQHLEGDLCDLDMKVLFPGKDETKLCSLEFIDRRTKEKVKVGEEKVKLFNDENIIGNPNKFDIVIVTQLNEEIVLEDSERLDTYFRDLSRSQYMYFKVKPAQPAQPAQPSKEAQE